MLVVVVVVVMVLMAVVAVRVAGELSQRMQIPGNVWVDVWQSARPVPARRQRRLFDDTKEAEKVLLAFTALQLIVIVKYTLE